MGIRVVYAPELHYGPGGQYDQHYGAGAGMEQAGEEYGEWGERPPAAKCLICCIGATAVTCVVSVASLGVYCVFFREKDEENDPFLQGSVTAAQILRTRWTTEANSVLQQNLIGYLIANLNRNLRGEI